MDAHLFRILSRLLTAPLKNARLERIFEPLPDVFSFTLHTGEEKKRLMFHPARSGSLLFLTHSPALPNPAFPPARVMRLRKYAEGRRLGPLRADWTRRRLVFPLPCEPGREAWLLLDMKEGPSILFALPEDFDAPVPWPDKNALEAFLAAPDETGPLAAWRGYPPLSPLLRRTLALLPPEEGLALLRDLEAGEDDLFACEQRGGIPKLCAWPLPAPLLSPGTREIPVPCGTPERLELFRAAQEPFLLGMAESTRSGDAVRDHKKAVKKRETLRKRLEAERERLRALIARKEDARLIQANLWRFPADAQSASLTVDDAGSPGGKRDISLDAKLTVRANMEQVFRQADRAARGMSFLEQRLAALDAGRDIAPASGTSQAREKPSPKTSRPSRNTPSRTAWAEFLSSDEFVMLRGKNAEGNKAVLKQARPFDLWFHTEDGPSAHLVLKRHHAEHAVPERTLREAAALVALKSDGKSEKTVRVICALVKDVSPLKGGAPGTVSVRHILHSLTAAPDPGLETALRKYS